MVKSRHVFCKLCFYCVCNIFNPSYLLFERGRGIAGLALQWIYLVGRLVKIGAESECHEPVILVPTALELCLNFLNKLRPFRPC